jgi:hypothetical protein
MTSPSRHETDATARTLNRTPRVRATVPLLLMAAFLPLPWSVSLVAQESRAGPETRLEARAARALAGDVRIDGVLDEASWRLAPVVAAFRQIEPVQGSDPLLRTEVRILHDEDNLYFGIEVIDPRGPAGLRVPEMRRNFDYFENDLVGVTLDGFGDGRTAMAFQVNPHGALRDLLVREGHLFDREWQGVWEARTRIHAGGWTAEIRIPWSTLRYDLDAEAWGMMLVRRSRALNEEVGWPEWPRQNNAYTMRYAGRLLGLEPPPPSRNLHLLPYVTGRTERQSIGGANAAGRSGVSAGGDLKWAVTPGTVLDLTLNTDFAEADVDREVLDLTRFSVLFPEQRPFFLENGALYRAGGDRWLEPFFSRRIGLDAAGRPIPLDGGTRVTHQSASLAGGGMVIRQREQGDSPLTHFAVGRIQGNIGGEHRIGALFVSRLEDGGVENHVGALDFFYRPRPASFLRGMVSASHTPGADAEQGWAAFAHLSNNFSWGYLGWVQVVVSPDYRAATGFVPRADLVTSSPAMNLDLRPAWLPSGVRRWTPGFTSMIHHRASDGRFEEGWLSLRPLVFGFQDGGETSLWARGDVQRLERPFRPIPGLSIDPGSYRYATVGITRQPDLSKPYWAYVTVAAGGFYDGSTQRLVYRASPVREPRFSMTFDYTGNRFAGVGGDPDQELWTHLVGVQLRVALDPRLQLSAFQQRNTVSGRNSVNARLSWEFAPLSFFHVVLNEGRPLDALDPDRTPFELRRDRQVTLKVSRLFQP